MSQEALSGSVAALESPEQELVEAVEASQTPLARRAVAALAAGLLSLSAMGGEFSPAEAEARAKQPKPSIRNAAKLMPMIQPVSRPKCTRNNRVIFSLRGTRSVEPGKKQKYLLTAKACRGTSKNQLKRIKVVHQAQPGKAKSLIIKNLEPGKWQKKKLSLAFTERDKSKKSAKKWGRSPKVSARAYGASGKRIGASRWNLRYKTSRPELAASCKPRRDYKVGIQDDSAFVWQKYGSRQEAFWLAKKLYGASVLRINLLYDDVKAYGYQPYVDTIKEAERQGMKVFVTLLPTPSYRTRGDQTLNYINLNPQEMHKFAYQSIITLGPGVTHAEIGNEPNHPLFSASRDLNQYLIMLRSGRDGALAANPNIKVIGGGLAPSAENSIVKWLNAVSSQKNVQASMHPYGHLINNLRRFKASAGSANGKNLYLSEYTNFVSNPNQMTDNIKAIMVARCAGAAMLIMYQLYDDPSVAWRGGILPAPGR